ncbi:hypothetical protein N9P20_00980 [Polaribacter sp.]|jgi:hypothetical protein|nr:hypothetical protein [Polaribacter sp.]
MNLLTQNSKLKQTSKSLGVRVFNFGIPAYKSASGKITCPFAGDCVKFCYAKKGAYIWSNVKPAFERRYELSKTDEFIGAMYNEITKKRPDYVRVHDSGDYYSKAYLNKWIDIALLFPEVKFYSYTNSVKMLKEADLPDNFDVIFSDSGKQSHLINAIHDRHTKIFKSESDLIAANYSNASKIDLHATKWFTNNNKVGLVMH